MASQAFVLHSRPYKETSALVDLFFAEKGRTRAVLRGARSRKGTQIRPFSLLEVELKGRGELKTLAQLDTVGCFLLLTGERLLCALYLNELLMRMLPLQDPQPVIFQHYDLALQALAGDFAVQPLLRTFEWRLLEQLGYGFSLTQDISGQAIEPQRWYSLQPESGFQSLEQLQPGAFLGSDLQLLAATQWQQPQVLRVAKRLMRQALAPHLGHRPLQSRELFKMQQENLE